MRSTDEWPDRTDRPGPLVPHGATGVVLCDSPSYLPSLEAPGPARRLSLDSGVDVLVAALNALPDEAATRARDRDLLGWVADSPILGVCNAMGYPHAYSLVLSYPDRPPAYVLIDENCGTVRAEGRTRFSNPDVVETFYWLYRGTLARDLDLASVSVPECPQTMPAVDVTPGGEIAFEYSHAGRWALTAPLSAATACRYQLADSGVSTLLTQESVRAAPGGAAGPLTALRDAANAQFRRGNPVPVPRCDAQGAPAPTVADLLVVVEVTGATWRAWVYRDPCPVAITVDINKGRYTATPELLTAVDGMLGPP